MKVLACIIGLFGLLPLTAQEQLRPANFGILIRPTAILQSGTEIRFDIEVKDSLNKPVHGARVTLQIETVDHHDTKVFKATEIEDGLYMAKPLFPNKGRWNVHVEARRDDAMSTRDVEYYVEK